MWLRPMRVVVYIRKSRMIVTVNCHGLRWGEIYLFLLDKNKATADIIIYYSHLNKKKEKTEKW